MRWTPWIAILAILLSSLLPTLGHAIGSGAGKSFVEVCTSQGSKWIQAGDEGTDDAPASAHLLDHCPYCSLQGSTPGLPPAGALALPVPTLAHAVPRAFLAAPRTLHAWRSAQPRAPPQFS